MWRIFLLVTLIVVVASSIVLPQRSGNREQTLIAKFKTPDHRIRDVGFSADGKLVAAGYGFYDDGGVTIWDISSRKTVATLLSNESKKGGVNKIDFSKDGKLFAAADSNGTVWLWRVGDWKTAKKLVEGRGDANGLVFSPDSSKLAFSSEEAVLLIDANNNHVDVIAAGKKDSRDYDGVSFTPDGKSVVVSGRVGTRVWDIATKKTVNFWNNPAFNFFGRLAPNGRYFISGGGGILADKSVEIRSFPAGQEIKELTDFRNGIFDAAISNSGKYFALGGGDYGGEGAFSLWSFEELKEVAFATFGGSPVQGLAFSPDDKMLAVGSEDGYVLLYDLHRFRGGEIEGRNEQLCGEVQSDGTEVFISGISKVPGIMTQNFVNPWRLAISNPDMVKNAVGLPIMVESWDLIKSSSGDQAKINSFSVLTSGGISRDYIVFGVGQNPGWSEGYALKIFSNGDFVASNNSGRCQSVGNLGQVQINYRTLREGILNQGFLEIPKLPLTIGADHYRTAFIEISTGGVSEIRSDADTFELLMKESGKTKKREAFNRVFAAEETFLKSLLNAGLR